MGGNFIFYGIGINSVTMIRKYAYLLNNKGTKLFPVSHIKPYLYYYHYDVVYINVVSLPIKLRPRVVFSFFHSRYESHLDLIEGMENEQYMEVGC